MSKAGRESGESRGLGKAIDTEVSGSDGAETRHGSIAGNPRSVARMGPGKGEKLCEGPRSATWATRKAIRGQWLGRFCWAAGWDAANWYELGKQGRRLAGVQGHCQFVRSRVHEFEGGGNPAGVTEVRGKAESEAFATATAVRMRTDEGERGSERGDEARARAIRELERERERKRVTSDERRCPSSARGRA
ncbi:hypothetical protein EDB86DRAFT_2836373 [Lactarius hatsudake]|nr:hypothetical protein EDB86DRAFT_2836373 [Lactarius hatsudake]